MKDIDQSIITGAGRGGEKGDAANGVKEHTCPKGNKWGNRKHHKLTCTLKRGGHRQQSSSKASGSNQEKRSTGLR